MSSLDSDGDGAARRPRMWRRLGVGALLLILSAAAIAAVAPRLREQARDAGLVDTNDPRVAVDREIAAEFGFENPVVWVIAANEGTVWTPALLRRVAALTREVFTIPGVVATDVVSLASPNLRDLRITDDGLAPVYLMSAVPETPEDVRALRTRVESDPKYAGTLISRDGHAAMVVANFMVDVDPLAVGAAALALRDRHRDAEADVHASGAPVLAVLAPQAARAVALPLAFVGTAILASFALVSGGRRTLALGLAATLAKAWLVVMVGVAGLLRLPWTIFALAPTAFVAAVLALDAPGSRRAILAAAGVPAVGFATLALVCAGPAAALGVAGAIGAPIAVIAAMVARWMLVPPDAPLRHTDTWPALARVVVVGALCGLGMLGVSFGMPGYALRYVPGEGGADLRAIAQRFPPPTAVAIRLRGTPGFVQEPAVLEALDATTAAARADPNVRTAMSLADVVKLVHRAFNDDDPRFERIPGERALVARYLALAYSPGFRRFVDRAFERTAVWAYLGSERPADVARVVARMQAALAAHRLADVVVDPPGGDGAVLLAMTDAARRLAAGGAAMVVVVALGFGLALGHRAGLRSLMGAAATAATAAGLLGWLGLPVDLLSLPATVAAVAAGAVAAGLAARPTWSQRRLALAMCCAGAIGVVMPLAAIKLVGILLIAPAVGLGAASVPAVENAAPGGRAPAMARRLHRSEA